MFRIIAEPARHRFELVFDGSFDFDPRSVLLEMKRVAPLVAAPEGAFDILADFSKVRQLPLDHARHGERALEWMRVHGLRKCASIRVGAAQRMVVERKTRNDPRFDFFLDREEAEWWLARDLPSPSVDARSGLP